MLAANNNDKKNKINNNSALIIIRWMKIAERNNTKQRGDEENILAIITPVANDNDDTIKYIDDLWSFIASHLSVVVINRLLPS